MSFDQAMYWMSLASGLAVVGIQAIAKAKRKPGKIVAMSTVHPLREKVLKVCSICGLLMVAFLSYRRNPILTLRFDIPVAIQLVGAVLNIVGVIIVLCSHLWLGKNWSGRVRIRADHELITSGPFRCIRHPLYLGFFLVIVGITLSLKTVAGIVIWLMAVVVYDIKARQEEKLLTQYFGEKYRRYQARTWRFIPYVY